MLPILRRLRRAPLIFIHILLGLILAASTLRLVTPPTILSMQTMSWWSRWLCRLLNVTIQMHGMPQSGNTLFVANHISWLDIFCIAAVCPTYFLAKQEVLHWPVLGWLCLRAGTAFIQRGGHREGVKNGSVPISDPLVERIQRDGRLLIFPEGTSTTGETVKRFYPRLFQIAIQTGYPVQAIAIRYPHPQNANRMNPVVPFVGEDSFLAHLWRLMGADRIVAEIYFAEPLANHLSRKQLAQQTHQQISTWLFKPHA